MTRYDPEWVKSHYDEYAEKEWRRWDASPVEEVKLHIHLHYLKQYLRPGDRILDIGAGAGRFTMEMARISDRIVAADISPVQLELNKRNARKMGFEDSVEKWVECDICDLHPHFDDEEFDAVVCYGGPLSYVFERRSDAIAELRRVTRSGGVLLFSVMSLWGGVHHFLPGVLGVPTDENRRIIATGDLHPDVYPDTNHLCHMFRASELRKALEDCGLEVELVSASNCVTAGWEDLLAQIRQDETRWNHILEMEIEASREPGCRDMGTHTIAAARRV